MALASRGQRDMDGGPEWITDEDEKRALRAQARRVLLQSLAWTVLTGVVVVLLPW